MTKQHTILAIDDLQESLDLYTSLMKKYIPSATCFTATHAQEGIDLALEKGPDLILIDAKMPEIDGFELSRRFKELEETAHIPVLMVSGVLTSREHRLSGFASGADGYICKPFQSEEFIAEINVLLRIKDNEDKLRMHEQHLEDELKKRTGDLVESEERFRILFENSPDAIFVESKEGRVVDVNKAACILHGMTRDELLGISVLDLVPHTIRPVVEKEFPRIFTQETHFLESSSLTGTGEVVPVEIRSRMIRYKKQDAVILIVRDISKRKKVEEALHQVATDVSPLTGFSFFYSLVQQLCDVLGVDFSTFSVYTGPKNQQLETVAFCGDGQVLENATFELTGTPVQQNEDRSLRLVENEFSKIYPDATFHNELQAESYVGVPLFFSSGSPLGVIEVFHRSEMLDVQLASSILQIFGARAAAEFERMQATEELWESEERYRSLSEDVLNRSVVGIFVLDKHFRIVWANQTAGKYFKAKASELVGMDMRQFVQSTFSRPYDPSGEFTQQLLASYDHGDYLNGEEVYIAPSGADPERWLEYFSQPIRSGLYSDGRIEHFTDITQPKNLQDQLLQVQKMEGIGRLAGGVAHDFNNLLTSILGFSNLLLDDLAEDSPLRSSVDEIIHAGQRAEKLTRQLLVFGRKQLMQVRAVNLNDIVQEMDNLLRRTLGEDIELITEKAGSLPAIEADSGQLEQVIMNLAVNARDAMPKGGRLKISTATRRLNEREARQHVNALPGDYVQLCISDSGSGMPQDVIEHAFEPFFTTKAQDKGTGLGLSIVYGIIKQFNGFIDLRSSEKSGTEFIIYLPASHRQTQTVKHRAKKDLPTGNETILVVEDEETVRHLTVRILKSLGYTVLEAPNGVQALEAYDVNKEKIDLIISDVVMPKMSGTDLVRELRQRYDEGFKVIFSSGFTEDTLEGHGISSQDSNLILKPYTRETLAQTVRDILDGNQDE